MPRVHPGIKPVGEATRSSRRAGQRFAQKLKRQAPVVHPPSPQD